MKPIDCGNLQRRSFLRGLAITAAGAVASSKLPAALAAAQAEEPLVLGTGRHRYEWVRGWGQLPSGKSYGAMHGGVAIDAQNHIYFTTEGEYPFVVFDAEGKFVRSFGKEWRPDSLFQGTHDIRIRREGSEEFIYLVSLFRGECAKLTLKGETVWRTGYPEQSGLYKETKEYQPTGIAIAPNGDFYVTDGYGTYCIHHYNAKAEYLGSWGGKGTEDGKFDVVHKVIVDQRGPEPLLLVTDARNHRLQWFTLQGKHVKTLYLLRRDWEKRSNTGYNNSDNDFLRLPVAFAFSGEDLIIADLVGRVTILDKDNKLIVHLGDSGDVKKQGLNTADVTRDRWVDGQFVAPHGVACDQEGNLYITEYTPYGRLEKLKRLA